MKEKINITDYANVITKALPKGIFLNTLADDKFNSMVIGWGHLGILWGRPTFPVYVRQGKDLSGGCRRNISYGQQRFPHHVCW